jgi:hypothetical protein
MRRVHSLPATYAFAATIPTKQVLNPPTVEGRVILGQQSARMLLRFAPSPSWR